MMIEVGRTNDLRIALRKIKVLGRRGSWARGYVGGSDKGVSKTHLVAQPTSSLKGIAAIRGSLVLASRYWDYCLQGKASGVLCASRALWVKDHRGG
jgi:hypothetical protein